MKPSTKVAVLTSALLILSLTGGFATSTANAPISIGAQWWMFALVFVAAENAVAHVEIRQQAHTLSPSEAVLLIGLIVLSPVGLIVARLVGATLAMALRRQPLQKLVFNSTLLMTEAAIAAMLLHSVFAVDFDGPMLWVASSASVLVAVTFGAMAVSLVISFFDSSRPVGLLKTVIVIQVLIATASLSLAVVGAAATAYAWTSVFYLLVLLGGVLGLLRRQAATAQVASNLESVGQFTSTLVGLTSTKQVVETALRQLAQTMRGAHSAIMVESSSTIENSMYSLDADLVSPAADCDTLAGLVEVPQARLLHEKGLDGLAAPIVIDGYRGSVVVWGRSTDVGHFEEDDLALFGAIIAQTQVALHRALLIDQLHYDAHHDALTRLPNRLGLAEGVDITRATTGALLVLDLDRFKDINDTLGHPTGDRALEIVARRLCGVVSESAVLARLGGDEFAVFDSQCVDAESSAALAAALIASIEQPIVLEDLSLQLGASIGIALAPNHGDDLTVLMSHADTAMYEAKRKHAGWKFYRHEDDTNDPRRLELVADLRAAIQERSLSVWYQPKLRLDDGSIAGAEALARWNHPRYGYVRPDEFIALAEGAGLMRELTDAIVEQVIEDAIGWAEEDRHIPVAVNLSTRNLLDDSLPARMEHMLMTGNIPAGLISFEITETAIMVDRERVVGLLDELHAMGIHLAIDDYGTGYSSLAYLRELPVDELKIDRSFITDVDRDRHNEVIVRSTIDMAHSLGLTVVAEGIERDAEWELLASLGCDYAQGYVISKPLPKEEFEAWVGAAIAPSFDDFVARRRDNDAVELVSKNHEAAKSRNLRV